MNEQDRIAEAEQRLLDHVSDGTGWCAVCGERCPCIYVKDARSLLIQTGRLEPTDAWPGDVR